MKLREIYTKNYKKLPIIPIVILIISLVIIVNQYTKTGDIINKDVSLSGGISATLYHETDTQRLEEFLGTKFKTKFTIRQLSEFGTEKQLGIIIESKNINAEELKAVLESYLNIKLNDNNFSIEETGSSLGKAFYFQMRGAILFAFLFMAIVVLIIYRAFIPAVAVISSAFFNMIVAIAVTDILGIELSTAGIAAILLLIGYGVDTDILLVTKTIKRKDDPIDQRIIESIKTGLTMTITTIIALIVGLIISTSPVIKQMFSIVLIGLTADIIITYLGNAPILKMYCIKKEKENA